MIRDTPNSLLWGWPWHGRVQQGSGADNSGLPSDMPHLGASNGLFRDGDGQAWLLDAGLPALSLTADETDEAAAKGWEWRNYAFVSGGHVYGTDLQTDGEMRRDAFIYFDANDKPWLFRLSVDLPGANEVDISADVVEFGVFEWGQGAQATFDVTAATVTCADIGPAEAYPGWTIEDVWTNGAKLLVSIIRKLPATLDGNAVTYKDIYSLIEVTVSGNGPGGLAMSAAEVRGGNQTTYQDISSPGTNFAPVEDLSTNDDCSGAYTFFSSTQFPAAAGLVDGRNVYWVFARYAHYDSAGDPVLIRIRLNETGESVVSNAWVDSLHEPGEVTCCGRWTYTANIEATYDTTWSMDLLADSTVIDSVGQTSQAVWLAEYIWLVVCTDTGTCTDCDLVYTQASGGTTYGRQTVDNAWTGIMAGESVSTYLIAESADYLLNRYRIIPKVGSITPDYDYASRRATLALNDGTTQNGVVGFLNAASNAYAACKKLGGATSYTLGAFNTPLGSKADVGTLASPYALYFTWNRKSGAYSFSTKTVCYV